MGREDFYEQRLLFGLPWHCAKRPTTHAREGVEQVTWTFTTAAPHTPRELTSFAISNGKLEQHTTFEQLCKAYEGAYEAFACECCLELAELVPEARQEPGPCRSCLHALGWHRCDREQNSQTWRAGSLHAGNMDIASTLWALARRQLPLEVMRQKLDEYEAAGYIEENEKEGYVETFEQMQGVLREYNVHAEPGATGGTGAQGEQAMMGPEELRAELERREALLQRLHDTGGQWTDQWRVYTESLRGLQDRTRLLRIFIQASAGTGKSFLLETIFLWCVVHGYEVSACAPTGIAAARIRVPRTPVRAYTLHYLFGLSVDLESTLDPSKPEGEKMARLARMQVLITDEASMIDDATWLAIKDQVTTVGAVGAVARGEEWPPGDDFGSAHQIICCDFK